jgi:hypothetical protein
MSAIDHLLTQPITIQNRAQNGTNGYGEPVVGDVGSPVATVGYIERKSSEELLVDRDTTTTDWTGYLLASATIGRLDYINFQSQKFQVMGEPENCYNPRTKVVSHIRVDLVAVTG